ncbi:MFS transporter [Nocardiopsis sediminis]|uniref:MFS transporter n=1 Tax=Nocardiopsis sediminis TaxID=1778267 RepID=A0ABV8FL81_9ACTN
MQNTLEEPDPTAREHQEHRWSKRLILWASVLILANVLADTAMGSPMLVINQLLAHFDTDQIAWLSQSGLLFGAIWSPLLAKTSDLFGQRRVLVITLLTACAGALVCFAAPSLWIFLIGRFLQGTALGSIFITVALVRHLCAPRVAMPVIGLVTAGASIAGIMEPLVMQPIVDAFGYRSVFVAAGLLAVVAAISVRVAIPETPVRSTGRIDWGGALLLGGGMGAVLAYISLGADSGWLSGGMLVLLVAGAASLAGWAVLALRVADPIVDIRALSRPILLTLLALVLAAGSFRGMLLLTSTISGVPADWGLGYGLGDGEGTAVLLSMAQLGIFVGGTVAGWAAGRFGTVKPFLAAIVVGTAATFLMLAGASMFPLALVCGATVGMAAGAISTSGYNLATDLAPPERQGTVSGLVSVMFALGSVLFSFAGGEILKATRIPDGPVVDGAQVSSATGVYLYILMAGVVFALAIVPAVRLMRRRPAAPTAPEAPAVPGAPQRPEAPAADG